MTAIRLLAILLAAASVLAGAPANAQLFRAYLKSTGSDANPCTVQAPCRLLPAALAATANGGEIWMLDSANYNTSTVTINKSVTILAIPGATGSVIATGGAQAINISGAGAQVALKNLVIFPALGASTSGITVTTADRLSVEGCLIYGLTSGAAIDISTAAHVKVNDSILRDNSQGVAVSNLGSVDIANSKIFGNAGHGVLVSALGGGNTTATVSDSVISGNGIGARAISGTTGAVARLYVNRVTASGNSTYGLGAESTGTGAAILSVGNSAINGNGTGIFQSGTNAAVHTMVDNYLADNTNDLTGALTVFPQR